MTRRKKATLKLVLGLAGLSGLLVLASCGGGSSSSSNNNPPPPVENTVPVAVNSGPANNAANILYVSVTICAPGTSNCQTVPDIQVDTGSEGLRLLSTAVTLSLPAETDNSSNGLQECVAFADGSYTWGPVVTADIKMAGEAATSVPIQLINNPASFPVPSSCASSTALADNTAAALGANGILGIGTFQQDCGSACAGTTSSVPALYYLCPNSVCTAASVPLASQVQNPVGLFARDNNGVLITLPSVDATGVPSVSGSLVFGVGTQSDNALGSAQIYTTDARGSYHVVYKGVDYSNSFIDSGSNGLFFLDSTTVGMPNCTTSTGFYCPASPVNFTVTTTGLNGTSSQVAFTIANADALFTANNSANTAFSELGGDNPSSFDFGLPFFYGRSVFVGIENTIGPNGAVGPYWAY